MTDLATYLDYGSTEISDDLDPRPPRLQHTSTDRISDQRKKMLVDMLGTALEYGGAVTRQDNLYADRYSTPREDIIPGANLWLQNENTGFTYEILTELLQAADMQDGIDWAWHMQGPPTRQLDTAANVLAFANPFSAVIDYGHAAWDLTSGDVSGARDAWNNVGDRLYGYDPNPYGSQTANLLGVHNWQDAVWSGLDLVDMISLGFGGEIIRPLRMMMANVIRRQGNNPEVAAAIYRSLREEWPERAIVRRAAEGDYVLPSEGYLVTRRTNPALGTSFGSSSERPQGLYTSLFEEEGLSSAFTGLSDIPDFAVVRPNNVLDVSDIDADLADMMGRGLRFIGGGGADTGVTALSHLAQQPGYTGQPLEWITRFTPEEQALREIPSEQIPDWLRESGHSMSYRSEERQLWSRTARILEYAETRFPDQNWRGMLMIDDVPSGITGEELGFQIWDTLLKLNQGPSGLGGNMQDPLGLLMMGLGASEARHVGYDAMIKRFPKAWSESTQRVLGQADPSTVNELVILTDAIATPTDMADELLKAYRRGELPLSRKERLLGEWDELGEVEQAQIADEYRLHHEDAWGEPAEALLSDPEVLMRWHNTDGRGYRDNIESPFTGLSRNDERAIWSGLQIQEREMIEADYRAAFPDAIDPDPAEMVAWDHRNSGRPETWMYTEDRSGRRTYKGHDAFENPAEHDIEAVKAELMYSDAQWEQARRAWAKDPQRIQDDAAKGAADLDADLVNLNPDPTDQVYENYDQDLAGRMEIEGHRNIDLGTPEPSLSLNRWTDEQLGDFYEALREHGRLGGHTGDLPAIGVDEIGNVLDQYGAKNVEIDNFITEMINNAGYGDYVDDPLFREFVEGIVSPQSDQILRGFPSAQTRRELDRLAPEGWPAQGDKPEYARWLEIEKELAAKYPDAPNFVAHAHYTMNDLYGVRTKDLWEQYPDAETATVAQWRERLGAIPPTTDPDRLAAAIRNDDGLDLFEYWKTLADESGYAESLPPDYWSEEGGLFGVLRNRTSPEEQFDHRYDLNDPRQNIFDERAAAGDYEIHDVFQQIRDFATKRLDELEAPASGPKRPDPFVDRVLPAATRHTGFTDLKGNRYVYDELPDLTDTERAAIRQAAEDDAANIDNSAYADWLTKSEGLRDLDPDYYGVPWDDVPLDEINSLYTIGELSDLRRNEFIVDRTSYDPVTGRHITSDDDAVHEALRNREGPPGYDPAKDDPPTSLLDDDVAMAEWEAWRDFRDPVTGRGHVSEGNRLRSLEPNSSQIDTLDDELSFRLGELIDEGATYEETLSVWHDYNERIRELYTPEYRDWLDATPTEHPGRPSPGDWAPTSESTIKDFKTPARRPPSRWNEDTGHRERIYPYVRRRTEVEQKAQREWDAATRDLGESGGDSPEPPETSGWSAADKREYDEGVAEARAEQERGLDTPTEEQFQYEERRSAGDVEGEMQGRLADNYWTKRIAAENRLDAYEYEVEHGSYRQQIDPDHMYDYEPLPESLRDEMIEELVKNPELDIHEWVMKEALKAIDDLDASTSLIRAEFRFEWEQLPAEDKEDLVRAWNTSKGEGWKPMTDPTDDELVEMVRWMEEVNDLESIADPDWLRDPRDADASTRPDGYTQEEIDQIVRNESGLTDKEIRDLMDDPPDPPYGSVGGGSGVDDLFPANPFDDITEPSREAVDEAHDEFWKARWDEMSGSDRASWMQAGGMEAPDDMWGWITWMREHAEPSEAEWSGVMARALEIEKTGGAVPRHLQEAAPDSRLLELATNDPFFPVHEGSPLHEIRILQDELSETDRGWDFMSGNDPHARYTQGWDVPSQSFVEIGGSPKIPMDEIEERLSEFSVEELQHVLDDMDSLVSSGEGLTNDFMAEMNATIDQERAILEELIARRSSNG